MDKIMHQVKLTQELVLNLVVTSAQKLGQFLPNLIGAIVVFLFGLLIASISKKIFKKIFSLIGINYISEKSGIDALLEKLGSKKKTEDILVSLIYFFVVMLFVIAATEILGIKMLIQLLNKFIAYIPQLFGAIFIFIFLSFIGKVVSASLKGFLEKSQIVFASFISKFIEIIIEVFALVIAIRQMGFDVTIFTANITLILGIVVGAIGLAFGLGAKNIFQKIVAGFYLRNFLQVGDIIEWDSSKGKIKKFETTSLVIETSDEVIIIPNDFAIEAILKKNKI